MTITVGRLAKLYPEGLPAYTKHAGYPLVYLVAGVPYDRDIINTLEPSTEIVVTANNARPRPNTSKAPFGKG